MLERKKTEGLKQWRKDRELSKEYMKEAFKYFCKHATGDVADRYRRMKDAGYDWHYISLRDAADIVEYYERYSEKSTGEIILPVYSADFSVRGKEGEEHYCNDLARVMLKRDIARGVTAKDAVKNYRDNCLRERIAALSEDDDFDCRWDYPDEDSGCQEIW